MPSSRRNLIVFCATFYLGVVLVLFLAIEKKTGGHFTYALDDPYIHLALAENLAHGHYGINPTEFSSPSSSILWPFLLIPLAGTRAHVFMPLAWNVVFGLTAACLIGWLLSRYPPQVDETGSMPWWKQAVTGIFVVLAANLPSLTIIGMEHVLQVLVAICCAAGMIEVLADRPLPVWCIVAAGLAPSVRYEGLALTAAICLTLAGLRRWRTAFALFCFSVAPLIAFSVFLKSIGLPMLPLSVMLKSNLTAGGIVNPGKTALARLFISLRSSIFYDFTDSQRFPILILTILFISLAWRASTRLSRFVYAGAAFLGCFQLIFGPFNWFHRYEVYASIFLLLLCLSVLSRRPAMLFGYFVLGLVFFASRPIEGTAKTAELAHQIYGQQGQMHRFVTEYYNGNYAVNDLGLVSFQRRPGAYVLDLYGLGSLEASLQKNKTVPWMEGIVSRHNAALAMIYTDWFDNIPPSWVPLAKMCEKPPAIMGASCVAFYSTTQNDAPRILSDLMRFSATVPKDEQFYVAQRTAEGGTWVLVP